MKKKFNFGRLHYQICLRLLILFLCFCLTGKTNAQNTSNTVSGLITDRQGNQLPGVTVVEEGTTNGTITNNDGFYTIKVSGKSTLIFSFVGMTSQRIPVNQRTKINVVLNEETIGLEEVVAIGYGTQLKKDITGAIASVNMGNVMKQPVQNSFQSLLEGRVAGLQISSISGAPGARVDVNIRGSSSLSAGTDPLYVIDGIQTGGGSRDFNDGSQGASYLPRVNPMSLLNPQDIESIQVLKDASSSAIYGARGANGVIIITTKRAKTGQEPRINLSSSYGMQSMSNTLNLMNGGEHAEFLNEYMVNKGLAAPFTATDISTIGEGTNWQKEVFKSAPVQSHQLSVTGSSGATNYFLSGSLLDQEGIALNSGLKRYTFRSNIEQRLGEKFKLTSSFTYSRSINKLGQDAGLDPNYTTALQRIYSASPTIALKDAAGNYIRTWNGANKSENPVESLEVTKSNVVGDNLLGNLSVDYAILKGLVFKTAVSMDINNRSSELFFPVLSTYIGGLKNGWGFISNKRSTSIVYDNTVTYSRIIGDHNMSAMAGSTAQKYNDFQSYMEGSNFPSNFISTNSIGSASGVPIISSGTIETGLVGFIGRLNYQYKEKYLLTGSLRRDGASVFAQENKWGNFPSFSAGWRVSQEPFMAKIKVINDLKIRAGYGITGNAAIGPYQSFAQMVYRDQYIFNNTLYTGVTQSTLANSELGWEETIQSNIGLDLAMWQSAVRLTLDYFDKKTSDMLFVVTLPQNSGFGSGLFNTGSVQNKGVEISFSANLFAKRKFNWNSEISFTSLRNKVVSLGNSTESYFGGYSEFFQGAARIVREGEPFGAFFGYISDGVWHTQEEIDAATAAGFTTAGLKPGYAKYRDTNDDKKIDANDRVIIGKPYADYTFGLSNNFSYKSFTLSIFIRGEMGKDVINGASAEIMNPGFNGSNKLGELLNRWTPTNTSSDIPSAGFGNYLSPSSSLIEDGSFVKIQNIQLAYNLAKFPTWLKSAQIYVSGQNLHTFTKYKGIDPAAIGASGIDMGAYPTSTTFVMGINLGF